MSSCETNLIPLWANVVFKATCTFKHATQATQREDENECCYKVQVDERVRKAISRITSNE